MKVNRLVLDLSHHNVVTDFGMIREAGIVGVIHKATEGQTYVDKTYRDRSADAREVGLLWGAYHFLRPGNMQAQAEHFVATAYDRPDVLLAADHEDPGVSADDLLEFLQAVENATGQLPIIYSGHLLKDQVGNGPTDLAGYSLWLAQYASNPSWPAAWVGGPYLWQFTDGKSGPSPHTCLGVEGGVDGDSFDGTPAQLRESWAGPTPEPAPEPEPAPPAMQTVTIQIRITMPAGARVDVTSE